jgi:hypothetical protein
MLTYEQAIEAVRAAGIPVHNAGPSEGYPDDYGVIMPGYHTVPRHVYEAVERWHGEVQDDMDAYPENYPRRWLVCDTDAGLATDENGEIVSYREGRKALEAAGWEYIGSGGVRVEVDPKSILSGGGG